jgi:hypothetical protein
MQSLPVGTEPRPHRHPLQGFVVILGTLLLLVVIAAAVACHPESIQGAGSRLLAIDVLLLLMYGAAGVWACYDTRPNLITALRVGARVGVLLGAVLIANHLIELFVPARPFIVIIGPVLLLIGLLGGAGSATWQRTGSLSLAVAGGVWCAIVAMLIGLTVAFCLSLAFRHKAELPLRELFADSSLNDPDAFLVRNSLEAISEGLFRTPIFALFFSFTGAIANKWISVSRPTRRSAALVLTPLMFVAGVAALWHANSLVRAARPPFVMSGVALASVALCSAHAIWAAFRPPNSSAPA